MRKIWAWLRDNCKKAWAWLRKYALNKEMFLWFLMAEAIFWSPCIVTGILAIVYDPWWWTAFGGIIAFWSGPFTPAVPLQIGLTVLLKKIFSFRKKKKEGVTCSKE